VAWYDPEQYLRLLELADDREQLHDTYEEWLEGFERLLARMGPAAQKVAVDVDELAAWCRHEGLPLDGAARARYVSEWLQKGQRPQP
jgi:hypothetical protein